jgi:hypothetical protein
MPWIVPSHQAPALGLKLWRPRWFSGFALCLGSMVPDLEFIFRITRTAIISHTVIGQLVFTVPATLVLHVLSTALILPWLVPRLPSGPPLYLEELRAVRPLSSLRDWIVAAWSALLGGLTHIGLDGFTHGDESGWAVPYLPVLRTLVPYPGGPIPLHDLLQTVLTIVLGAVSIFAWRRAVRKRLLWRWRGIRRPAFNPAVVFDPFVVVVATIAWALVGTAVGLWWRPIPNLGIGVEIGAYGALTFVAIGAVMAAIAEARAQPPGNSASKAA